MSRRGGTGSKKDVLLELVSRDIKELQRVHSESAGTESKIFTEAEEETQLLCDHLDHILMHGLRNYEEGYWPFVSYFTRTELVGTITHLRRVTTSLGRGRCWLVASLSEQSVESYVRMFAENQEIVEGFYLRDAFLRDMEHLLLLLTLVSGLDFISFNLEMDCDYLDYGASRLSSQITSHHTTFAVTPTFLSSKVTADAGGRSRALSDPTHKPPGGAVTTVTTGVPVRRRRGKDSSTGQADLEKSREKSNFTGPNCEPENGKNMKSGDGAHVDGGLPMMSSSLQITSSRNVLERMGSSLEKRSPFLERAGSRERAWPGVGGGEGVKGDGGEDDMLVARGRRSGRSKKRRRKRNENYDVVTTSSSDHMIPGTVLFDPVEPKPTRNANDPIPAGYPRGMGTGECDFETELRGGVALPEREGERGLSLEAELALAARDESSPAINTDTGRHSNDTNASYHGNNANASYHGKGEDPSLDEDVGLTLLEAQNDGDGFVGGEEHNDTPPSPTLTPSHPHHDNRLLPPHTGQPSPAVEVQPTPKTNKQKISENQEILKSKQKSFSASLPLSSSSSRLLGSERARERERVPEFEREYDVITQRDVSALGEGVRRGRANAVYLVSEGSDGESGEMVYREPPKRPREISEEEKKANDIKIDETMRVVFSIDIYLPDAEGLTPPPTSPDHTHQQRGSQGSEEEAKRLILVSTPSSLGQYRVGYMLITTEAVYLLRRDGIEGIFSREFGARFQDIDHLVIGLGWQSVEVVYRERGSEGVQMTSRVIVTGSEGVSRSLMDSIQAAATECPGFHRVIPRNRDDEAHLDAIERELIKLGSETSMDVVQYSLVSWEQVKGGPHLTNTNQPLTEVISGPLHFKKNSRVGLSSWKQGFFRLVDGTLQQFGSESDKKPQSTYSLTGCGGCTRLQGENRQFVLSVALDNTQPLLLATTNEEEMTRWQQALCEAVLQVPSTERRRNPMCTVLLTKGKIHILQEDMSRGAVRHITCCEVTAVERISVDHHLPYYCTVSYDDGQDSKGEWLLCFISEFELGRFETTFAELWKEEFQIDLPFSEVKGVSVKQRARHTLELMHSVGCRSDSITKGRTEFAYSSTF